jgi:hypothetical protein
MSTIKEYERNYKEAGNALREYIAKVYPLGTRVTVNAGKSRIEAEVIGHAASWCLKPDEIRVRNIHTLKSRNVSATSEYHDLKRA